MPMSGMSGAGKADSASDHARSMSALASKLGVQLLRRQCQVLKEPPPAQGAVQVRPMTLTSARVNIGSHGDFNASGMCKVLEEKTESMRRLEEHCRSGLIVV